MGSSDRLFNRERNVHEILGGGLVADVILWRRIDLTKGILVVAFAACLVFETSGYTLLSLLSSVLLLLFTILFLWAKSAAIVNQPAPPLPDLYLSEETASEVATFIRENINVLLSVSKDIALGRDTQLFIRVATNLLLISVIGCTTDFLTLGYVGLIIILTVPAICERYEDRADRYILIGYRKLLQLYLMLNERYIYKVHNGISGKAENS